MRQYVSTYCSQNGWKECIYFRKESRKMFAWVSLRAQKARIFLKTLMLRKLALELLSKDLLWGCTRIFSIPPCSANQRKSSKHEKGFTCQLFILKKFFDLYFRNDLVISPWIAWAASTAPALQHMIEWRERRPERREHEESGGSGHWMNYGTCSSRGRLYSVIGHGKEKNKIITHLRPAGHYDNKGQWFVLV